MDFFISSAYAQDAGGQGNGLAASGLDFVDDDISSLDERKHVSIQVSTCGM